MEINKSVRFFYLDDELDDYLDAEYLSVKNKLLDVKKARTERFKKHNIDAPFFEFIKLLNINTVSFIIVGSYAVAFYDQQRLIGDIDFWVDSKEYNLKRVIQVLSEFGIESMDGISLPLLSSKNLVIQVGKPPFRIDLIINLRELIFETCITRCSEVFSEGITFPILGIEDLILSKSKSNRAKDIRDIFVLSSKIMKV